VEGVRPGTIETGIRTVFDQAYDAIRTHVQNLRAQGECKLSSEPALAKDVGVSRRTVRRVLERLAREHLIIRQKGRGTFIRPADETRTFTVLHGSRVALFHPWMAAILLGASNESETLGVQVRLKRLPEWGGQDLGERLVAEAKNLITDGYLVPIPIHLKDCLHVLAAQIPLVMLTVNFGRDDVPAVLVDDQEAGRLAGRYFAERGYRRTALISGPTDGDTIRKAQAVLDGMREVLRDRAPIPNETHILTDRSELGGRDALDRLLRLEVPCDAIMTTEHGITEGVIRGLRESGLGPARLPEVLPYIDPNRRTRERLPERYIESPSPERLGREAVRMLHTLLSGRELEKTVKWLFPKFV